MSLVSTSSRSISAFRSRIPGLVQLAMLLALSVFSWGCFQSDAVLHLNADGSGTIEMSVLVNEDMAAMMSAGSGDDKAEPGRIMSDAELIEKGSKLGDGVRFVSSELIEKPGFKGINAKYEFDDINKVHLEMSPSEEATASSQDEPITFAFTPAKGGLAHLSIHIPQDDVNIDATGSDAEADTPTAEEVEQMRSIFKGMRFSARVETGGEIVTTNSPYQDGKTVTLLELDLDQLLGDVDKFTSVLAMGQPKNMAEVMERLKDIPGIKVNPTDTVTIDFKVK
ncbi:MAG: hypothetical protein R3E12_15730 [Candidatus Eisenbacteria bacterium]|uniref:Uncharacterized protein n=1 Tax=Eiseniibacteriota bacterium TaxID=2212470 RepID=A0A956LWX5_UNCEI|nr:hypothetical protein [Candidatus Eisenbacteria bacterium]